MRTPSSLALRGTLALAVLAAIGSVASAGTYTTYYTINLKTSMEVHHVLAVDEFADGSHRTTALPDFSGVSNTLYNPVASSTPVSSFFLIGLYTHSDNTDHLFLTMTDAGAASAAGKLFSQTFAPYSEHNPAGIVQLVPTLMTATSGLPSSDPGVAAALTKIVAFGDYFHNTLYTAIGTPGRSVTFTVAVPHDPNGSGTIVPLPASVATGSLMLATLGLARLGRSLRRRGQKD